MIYNSQREQPKRQSADEWIRKPWPVTGWEMMNDKKAQNEDLP